MRFDLDFKKLRSKMNFTDYFFLVGIRGFHVGENLRGVYDDRIAVCETFGEEDHVKSFNSFMANTDPSRFNPGMAVLREGVWRYKIGIHGLSRPIYQRCQALVQAEPVIIDRDEGPTEKGWFGINIHKGGINTTGSEGCQTIISSEWNEFLERVILGMDSHNLKVINYVLISANTWRSWDGS